MKKTITIAVLIIIVVACHRKMVPATNTTSSDTIIIEEPKSDVVHAEMLKQGKAVYINRCGRCHGLKPVEKYTAKDWDGILKIMIPKARLNETEGQQVTTYVIENSKKQITD